LISNTYVELLRQIDEAIEIYMSKSPEHGVSVRISVSGTDASGRPSAVTHELERGNVTVSRQTVISQSPVQNAEDDVQALIDCSIALMENGNFESATESAREAIGLQPQNAGGHIALWRALRAAGQNDEAYPAIVGALQILETQDLPLRIGSAAFEISTRETFAQWLFLLDRKDEAKSQTYKAIDLAEQAGLKDRLDWLNLQLQTMEDNVEA